MGKLKLEVNAEKTRICKMPDGTFDFLGYTFGRAVLMLRANGAALAKETELVSFPVGRPQGPVMN
jgi:hypothetical protein